MVARMSWWLNMVETFCNVEMIAFVLVLRPANSAFLCVFTVGGVCFLNLGSHIIFVGRLVSVSVILYNLLNLTKLINRAWSLWLF